MNDIIYLSFDDVLKYYCDTIEQSGGGMSGIREKSGIEMILDLVQNDVYYPSFEEKLTYLVYAFCTGIILQMVINAYHLLLALIFLLRIGMGGQVSIFCLIWKPIFGMLLLVT